MALHVVSPLAISWSTHGWPPVFEAGSASWSRSRCPRQREPGVEDPAGIERRLTVVDHRQRCDRGEVRRIRRADEQLADAAVGDPHRPDLVVQHPRLPGDGLDDVVAVEALEALEVVKRTARAAGAPHVDVDDGEAEQVRDLGEAAVRTVERICVAVAGVLNERRVRALPGARECGRRSRASCRPGSVR